MTSVVAHYLAWRYGLRSASTQTSPAERACLTRHAGGRRRLVEIGVFEGVTTLELRRVMAPDGVLFAVDPFPAGRLGVSFHERIARAEADRSSNGRVEWIRATGAAAAADPRVGAAPMDFVFVDGDHHWDGIAGDWEAWSGRMAPGGIIAFHDSRNVDAPSARFTESVVLTDPRYELLETEETVTVVRRRA